MKLYTVKEAAKLVGVSTNTLYKYLDEDRIHAARGSAIQGRFRIPQSALEEFLGVKLSVEPMDLPASDSCIPGMSESDPHTNVPDDSLKSNIHPLHPHLPLKIARFFLFLALVAILVDLFISTSVSPISQLARLFFVAVMILLSYQEGGFRRS